VWGDDDANGAIDEGERSGSCAAGACPARDLCRAANLPRGACAVGTHDDVGIEHGKGCFEIAAARGGPEGLDHLSFSGEVGGPRSNSPALPVRG
jgi:hypothetical protein